MFTEFVFSDWERATEKEPLIQQVIAAYKGGCDFMTAVDAQRYYDGNNTTIASKVILEADAVEVKDETGRTHVRKTNKEIPGNRIVSGFFHRFVAQQANFLLGNGVTLAEDGWKERLGRSFDTVLSQIGETALVQGVCWGYWNVDHLEKIEAATDVLSGAVALLDEITGEPRVLIQFGQLSQLKPMWVRVFESDGVTMYRANESGGEVLVTGEKRPYKLKVMRDAFGEVVLGGENYAVLPVFPLYANASRASELTPAIKSKIDLYDRVMSDFGDNLDRANEVYWVLNNFGGNNNDVLMMLKQIRELRTVISMSDGAGGASAEPRTIEVPYSARQTALELLEKQLYQDYMALNMSELTGGSLTNVAIKAAMSNLNLKADAFEWECFTFVQNILTLLGIDTESITFKRAALANDEEIVKNIYMMREDIDKRTALALNPYITQDDIEDIIGAAEFEKATGVPDEETLKKTVEGGEPDDGGTAGSEE